MNAKWRTQRHLSIRDLDWRSLFLSDSLFHAIDDHIGLPREERLVIPSSFFPLFSSSSPFCLFLSKRLHNNRPYCDHGAPLNLNYYAAEEVFLPSRVSSVSHERVLQLPITTYDIISVFLTLQERFHFPVFPAFIVFFSSLLPCSQDRFDIVAIGRGASTLKISTRMNHRR